MSAPSRQRFICVYCAAGPVPAEYVDLATELGTAIGKAGYGLVSGGGSVSMMGAVASAARAAGATSIGVIPTSLLAREVGDRAADELIVTDTMRERKTILDERSDAFITLPGGIGTLEEFFEIWTARFLHMTSKPLTVLDPFGHYDKLFAWIDDIAAQGFVAPAALTAFQRTRTVAEALAFSA